MLCIMRLKINPDSSLLYQESVVTKFFDYCLGAEICWVEHQEPSAVNLEHNKIYLEDVNLYW